MERPAESLARILFIDDNRPYAEALHRDAQALGLALRYAGSLEEGRERFEAPDGWSLTGVILDVKCLKERGQQVPDNSFLTAAVRYFSEKAPHLPVVALTGEPDQYRNLRELYAGTLRVYSKGKDEEEMLLFLREAAGRLDYVRILAEHRQVFDVVGRYLGSEAEQELLSCMRAQGNGDAAAIRNSLTSLRRLQERVYITLSRADERLVPGKYVSGEINLVACYKHLAEKGVVERYRIIDRFSELVYKVTSDSGAHSSYTPPKYPPTLYTLRSVTCALCDLLLWFGRLMDETKK